MYRDRTDAALQLAQAFKGRQFVKPIVLAIPRGGVVTGAVLAKQLGADLDVVLSRKLRAPYQPELAIGSISEDGRVYLTQFGREGMGISEEYLNQERQHQLAEIARRKSLFRAVRPAQPLSDRSVIVTDDGIATGATMIAALQTVRKQNPKELIVAAPVGSPDRIQEVKQWCDEVVCPLSPDSFWGIGQFYEDFSQVEDEEVVQILRQFKPASGRKKAPTAV